MGSSGNAEYMGVKYQALPSVLTMQVSLLIFLAMLGITTANTWQAAHYTLFREKRAAQRTRFFTGNNAVDAGAADAALGVATRYSTLAPGEVPGVTTRQTTQQARLSRATLKFQALLLLGLLPLCLCAPAPQKKVSVETGMLIGALTAGLLVKALFIPTGQFATKLELPQLTFGKQKIG